MSVISANELKTRGISIVESQLEESDEAIITVRGKEKYVIMDVEKYNKIREYELEIALLEARSAVANGSVISESVDDHMKRVLDDI